MKILNVKKKQEKRELTIGIDRIEIPLEFHETTPKNWKMRKVIRYYKNNGDKLDKPITVVMIKGKTEDTNTYLLTDGYTRYLAAKNYFCLRSVPIKIIEVLS